MIYVKIGNSDLRVSKICLGCMGFGDSEQGMHKWTLDEEKSREIIAYALDQGINFFDTAMAYQNGTSELFLGRALKKLARREDVVVATKFFGRTKQQIDSGISCDEHIRKCLDDSLERLQMDYIDLYILHAWDPLTPIEETLRVLNDLICEGKIRYIGVSNVFAWQVAKANEIAILKGYQPFISVQGHYNLIFREEEREMIPYCDLHHVALTPYSALASGRLAKRANESSLRLETDTYAKGKYDMTEEIDAVIIDEVSKIADSKNVSMAAVAISWLNSKVTSPIIGVTKKHHIDGAIEALSVHLDDEEIKRLEKPYKPHALVGMMASKK